MYKIKLKNGYEIVYFTYKICKDLNINIYYLAHGKLITVEGQAVFKRNMRKFGESNLLNKIYCK